MATEILKVDPLDPQPEIIRKAANYIREGKLVAIPTETVYGLAANIANKEAMRRLYEVKGRPKGKPFTVCIAYKEALEQLAQDISPFVYRLIDKFWPGPLTLVLKARGAGLINNFISLDSYYEGRRTIGLRMPNNRIALGIIDLSGVKVVLPSANISDQPAPLCADDILKSLGEEIDLIIDAGPADLGIESSVVDATDLPVKILREGAIKKEEIEKIANKKRVLFVCTGNSCRSVMAHGLLEKALKEKNRNDVEVLSSGVGALIGAGPTQETLSLLGKEEVDMSSHRARLITRGLLKSSDFILVMEDLHEKRILELLPDVKNRLYLLKEFAKIQGSDLNIGDPIGRGIDFYQGVFYTIKECVGRIVDII